MKVKNLGILFATLMTFVIAAAPAMAHVELSPTEAVPGDQSYDISVPNEKDNPTTELKLIIPDGVDVINIKPVPGWTHTEVKVPNPEAASGTMSDDIPAERITQITWSGGTINPGEYQVFSISTIYSGEPKQLVWKAYQNYSDGSVVAWDDTVADNPAPKVDIQKEAKIDALANDVNDLQNRGSSSPATWLGVAAVLLSVIAVIVSFMKRHH